MRPFHSVLLTALLATAACDGPKPSGDGATTTSAAATDAPGAATSTGAPTEDDVKALITRRAQSLATGVGSSHSAVEIEFASVEIAPGRPLNEQDRIDGIKGDTAWPVRARWTEHRRWGAADAGGSTEDVPQYYSYDFFRDSFGGWDVLGHGPVI